MVFATESVRGMLIQQGSIYANSQPGALCYPTLPVVPWGQRVIAFVTTIALLLNLPRFIQLASDA